MEENTSKPEEKLRPIMYTSWLLGVGVARPQNCPNSITIILRVIHFGLCSVIVAFSAMDFVNFGKVFPSQLFEIMYWMNETMCHVASYYYVCHLVHHYGKWPELMKKLESLDLHIGKEVSINDGSMKIRQILAVLTVCLSGPVSLIVHVIYYYFTAPDQIFASDLLLYYTISQTLVNSFVFDTIVYMICQRFRAINQMIEQLNEGSGTHWIALKIRRIRRLHNGTYINVLILWIHWLQFFEHLFILQKYVP